MFWLKSETGTGRASSSMFFRYEAAGDSDIFEMIVFFLLTCFSCDEML